MDIAPMPEHGRKRVQCSSPTIIPSIARGRTGPCRPAGVSRSSPRRRTDVPLSRRSRSTRPTCVLDYKLPELDGGAVTRRGARAASGPRAARLCVHGQRRRLQGARDRGGGLRVEGGPPRGDRGCGARLRPRRERRPAGRGRRPRLGDPPSQAGRLARADTAGAGDPAPDRSWKEPARDREELYLGLTTVKTHVQHLYEKLGVSDRAAAVATAMRRGLIE